MRPESGRARASEIFASSCGAGSGAAGARATRVAARAGSIVRDGRVPGPGIQANGGQSFDRVQGAGYRVKTLAWRGTILACLILGCGPMTATGVMDDADTSLRRARA